MTRSPITIGVSKPFKGRTITVQRNDDDNGINITQPSDLVGNDRITIPDAVWPQFIQAMHEAAHRKWTEKPHGPG